MKMLSENGRVEHVNIYVYIFVYVYICIYINIYIHRRANRIYIQKVAAYGQFVLVDEGLTHTPPPRVLAQYTTTIDNL